MAGSGTTWLVDKSRIATKIKCASGACDPEKVTWKSNPTKACPSCQHAIDNSDVAKEWPGLPKGVKFDPSDQEIIWHLLAKVGSGNSKPHPFIDEFITTIEVEDGICYTHPQKLPGVKQDGNASHFFHRAIKAYNTGTRKRRKIHDQDFGDVRWHKTGRTKPVLLNGVQKGCKKIMVLYMSSGKGGKAEKTNWVMHQYHLGTEEDENDGEYVISKVFYQQQQQVKLGDNDEPNVAESTETTEVATVKVDPVTPKSATPDLPFNERRYSDLDLGYETLSLPQKPPQMNCLDETEVGCEEQENAVQSMVVESEHIEGTDNKENNADDGQKWWDSESQNLLDSQQLVEALSLCDDFFHSQSPKRDERHGEHKNQPSLSDYAQLGSDHLKKDIEDCQNLFIDPPAHVVEQNPVVEPLGNVEHDTPSEHRLSQLEFGSQDSCVDWGYSKVVK